MHEEMHQFRKNNFPYHLLSQNRLRVGNSLHIQSHLIMHRNASLQILFPYRKKATNPQHQKYHPISSPQGANSAAQTPKRRSWRTGLRFRLLLAVVVIGMSSEVNRGAPVRRVCNRRDKFSLTVKDQGLPSDVCVLPFDWGRDQTCVMLSTCRNRLFPFCL